MNLLFGEFELDRERFELRRSGRRVHLEPRVLELLLYLAEHRDRVVLKQELFDEVWRSKFVSESTLTGAVADARHALGGGDPQKSPIQNVHGRGYRFLTAETPEVVPAETGEAAPAAVEPRPAARRLRPILIVGAAALAIAVVLVWREGTRPDRPVPRHTVRLVLAPLAAGSGEELRLVALSIQDLLTRRLEQVEGLELETPGSGLPSHSAPTGETLRALGSGAYLVTGALSPSPDPRRARLRVDLYDFRSGGEASPVRLTEHDVPFLENADDLQNFLVLRDAIARQVLERLRPFMASSPRAAAAPRNVEAYRLYLQTLQPLREAVCVGPAAIALLERSLALDPQFAPAWAELGWARYNSVSSCGEAAENYRLALEAGERARQLEPASARALGLEAVVRVETGEVEEAYAMLLEAERAGSAAGPDVPYFQSYALNYAGFLELSQERVEEALLRDATFLADGGWTPNAWLYRRDFARFLELLPAGGSPLFRFYRGFAELQRSNPAAAREVLAPAFAAAPNDLFARLSEALLAVVDDQPDRARAILDQVVLQRDKTRARDGEVTFKIAQLYAAVGERPKAVSQLSLAVEQGFFCVDCFRGDPRLASLLEDPAAARALNRADERHSAFGRRFGATP